MENQNVSCSERIQAACAHLLILFLFAIITVITYIQVSVFYAPLIKKLDVLSLIFVGIVYSSLNNSLVYVSLINYFLLFHLSKLIKSPFVTFHVQKALNFAEISLLLNVIGTDWFFINKTLLAEFIKKTAFFELSASSHISCLISLGIWILWYSQVIFAVIRSLRGFGYQYFVSFQFKFRDKKLKN